MPLRNSNLHSNLWEYGVLKRTKLVNYKNQNTFLNHLAVLNKYQILSGLNKPFSQNFFENPGCTVSNVFRTNVRLTLTSNSSSYFCAYSATLSQTCDFIKSKSPVSSSISWKKKQKNKNKKKNTELIVIDRYPKFCHKGRLSVQGILQKHFLDVFQE